MRPGTRSLIVALAATVTATAGAANDPARPSILLVITDDQRYDTLGCTGHPAARTPNIDRLAQDGILFRDLEAYPKEERNLASDPAAGESLSELRHALQRLLSEAR